MKTVYRSLEWKRKISEAMLGNPKVRMAHSGENSPFWRGGKLDLDLRIKKLIEYGAWKNNILMRDEFTCVEPHCGSFDVDVHHEYPWKLLMAEFLDLYSHLSPFDDKEELVQKAKIHTPFWEAPGITCCRKHHMQYEKDLKYELGML